MKEFKGIGSSKKASQFEKALGWMLFITTFYLFPSVAAFCFVTLVLLGITMIFVAGFAWLMWTIVLIYAFLVLGSKGFSLAANSPNWTVYKNRNWLFTFAVLGNKGMAWVRSFHSSLWFEAKRFAVLGKQFAKWSGEKFWNQSLKTKLIATAIVIPVLLWIMFISLTFTVTTVKSKWPYGKDRGAMTGDDLLVRKQNRINSAMFAVWGKDNAEENAKKMDQFKNLVYSSAKEQGITPERFEGLLFVEGSGRADQINSKSGAAGIAQIMLTVGCEEGLIRQGSSADKAFCKQVRSGNLLFIPANKNIVDRRLDPKFAIPTAAKILGKAKQYWGEENWGFVQYHMGVGNLRILCVNYLDEVYPGWDKEFPINRDNIQASDPSRSVPKAIAKYGFTYDDIFFRCTPNKTPRTYDKLYRMADFSATYVYGGLAATAGLALMRSDYNEFTKMIAKQQTPDGGLANIPMRAWWDSSLAKRSTLADVIADVKRGELVPVPSDAKNGFVLRTTGPSRIGQCDPGNEGNYYFTQKATLGMIYYFAERVKEQEGADPFEITGLIRTNWMYDTAKCLPDTKPRTHVIGVAFDIGATINGKPMSAATRKAINFVIRDLGYDGLIYRIEESTADHIVYNPDFESFFVGIYNDHEAGKSALVVK